MNRFIFIHLNILFIYHLLNLNSVIASPSSEPPVNPISCPFTHATTTLEYLLNMESPVNGFLPVSFKESMNVNQLAEESDLFDDLDICLIEERFESFCQNINQPLSSTTTYSIPQIIHLIWLGSDPTEAVRLCMASWQKYHPGWEIRLWTDSDIKDFPWQFSRSKSLFLTARNWAEKSDILRFEILYQFGGIYTDIDIICLKSFEDLIKEPVFFACFEDNTKKFNDKQLMGSAIIGTTKNNPIMERCIDYTQSFREAPLILQHHRSGPGPLSKAAYEAINGGTENILILPCSYFYPLPWKSRLAPFDEIIANIRPESFAIHLWEYSWATQPKETIKIPEEIQKPEESPKSRQTHKERKKIKGHHTFE